MQEVRGVATVLINLHTMNPLFDAPPYTVYKHHPDSGIGEEQLLAAMACFHPRLACRDQALRLDPHPLKSDLACHLDMMAEVRRGAGGVGCAGVSVVTGATSSPVVTGVTSGPAGADGCSAVAGTVPVWVCPRCNKDPEAGVRERQAKQTAPRPGGER